MTNDEGVLKSLPPIGVLISEAWANYKNKFSTILQIALVPLVVNLAIGFAFRNVFKEEILGAAFAASDFSSLWQSLPLGLLSVVLGVLSTVAMLLAFNDQAVSDSVVNYYGRALRKFFPYIWVSIISGLVVFAGIFLFIIPGIVVAIWTSFAVYILINENIGGFSALARSREYVRGYWWDVFGRVLVVLVLFFVVGLVGGLILTSLTHIVSLPSFMASPVENFLSSIVAAFMFSYILVLYHQVRAAKGQVADGSKTWAAVLASLGVVFVIVTLLIVPILLISLVTAKQKTSEVYDNGSGSYPEMSDQGFTQ